jgi:hypothetical protein
MRSLVDGSCSLLFFSLKHTVKPFKNNRNIQLIRAIWKKVLVMM